MAKIWLPRNVIEKMKEKENMSENTDLKPSLITYVKNRWKPKPYLKVICRECRKEYLGYIGSKVCPECRKAKETAKWKRNHCRCGRRSNDLENGLCSFCYKNSKRKIEISVPKRHCSFCGHLIREETYQKFKSCRNCSDIKGILEGEMFNG